LKKILGISGSPRKLGNSEIIVKEISRMIPVRHELNLLALHDLKIEPCGGCYKCLISGDCYKKDDYHIFRDALLNSDALIVATPTYCLGANASLRQITNRAFALNRHIDLLWNKPSIGIGICGINGKEGYTLLDIENFLALLFSNNKKCVILTGALPGEIFLNKETKKIARELAELLLGPEKTGDKIKDIPSCPLCGGTTFRFKDVTSVSCVLCSNTGTVEWIKNRPVFSIERDDHSFILSKNAAKKHYEWLLGMKDRFIKHKRELKKITLQYLD
jgi:multimeric flavodoxin WrbA